MLRTFNFVTGKYSKNLKNAEYFENMKLIIVWKWSYSFHSVIWMVVPDVKSTPLVMELCAESSSYKLPACTYHLIFVLPQKKQLGRKHRAAAERLLISNKKNLSIISFPDINYHIPRSANFQAELQKKVQIFSSSNLLFSFWT